MIVGQQTNGWDDMEVSNDVDNAAESLMGLYDVFNLGERYSNTPFWKASHEIFNRLNPKGPPNSFLWSNLVKVDQKIGKKCGRPHKSIEDVICNLELFQMEIRITKPDVVVFFTGPFYEERLRQTFPEIYFSTVFSKVPPMAHPAIQRLKHDALPYHSYQSYHPKYLQMNKIFSVMDKLTELCEQNLAN